LAFPFILNVYPIPKISRNKLIPYTLWNNIVCSYASWKAKSGRTPSIILSTANAKSVYADAYKIAHKTPLFSNESRGSAVLFLAAAALCIPLAALINFEQSALRLVCLILAALICGTMHAINFLYISCLPGRFAAYGKAATASGFCNAFTYVGAAVSMYGISSLAENLGWSATAISWIGVAALGLCFSMIALKKYSAFLQKDA
jgi:hypothetical protein